MQPFNPYAAQFNPQAYQEGGQQSRLHQLAMRQLGGQGYGSLLNSSSEQDFDAYMRRLLAIYGTPDRAPPMLPVEPPQGAQGVPIGLNRLMGAQTVHADDRQHDVLRALMSNFRQ